MILRDEYLHKFREVDDRGIELAEHAVHELRTYGSSGLDSVDIDQALAALSAVRTLTKED